MAAAAELPYTLTVRVQFMSAEHAGIARDTMAVDQELQPDKTTKLFRTEGETLVADMAAVDARTLRVMVSSVFDMLGVVTRTLRDFS